jgi:hypothetical protein
MGQCQQPVRPGAPHCLPEERDQAVGLGLPSGFSEPASARYRKKCPIAAQAGRRPPRFQRPRSMQSRSRGRGPRRESRGQDAQRSVYAGERPRSLVRSPQSRPTQKAADCPGCAVGGFQFARGSAHGRHSPITRSGFIPSLGGLPPLPRAAVRLADHTGTFTLRERRGSGRTFWISRVAGRRRVTVPARSRHAEQHEVGVPARRHRPCFIPG